MKTNAIIRIVVYSLGILLLVGVLLGVLDTNFYLEDGRVHSYALDATETAIEMIEQEEITSPVRNIEIEWVSGSVTIAPDENAQSIHVTEYCPRETDYQMVMKQSGQTLKIQFSEKSMMFPSLGVDAEISKDLVIIVPSNWACDSIEIDAAATDVEVHDIRINEFDFDGASGRLALDNCEIVKLDIDTASGDVEFSGTLKELDFDAASAKFHGEFHQVPNHLNLDAMSGDVELVLPSYSGFHLELDTMSGSFDSDFDFHTTGTHYECGDGACKIKVSAMSGDVTILKGIDTSAGKNSDH